MLLDQLAGQHDLKKLIIYPLQQTPVLSAELISNNENATLLQDYDAVSEGEKKGEK